MDITGSPEPIFARLVRERGDVPALVRDAAEREWRNVSRFTGVPLGDAPRPASGGNWQRVGPLR